MIRFLMTISLVLSCELPEEQQPEEKNERPNDRPSSPIGQNPNRSSIGLAEIPGELTLQESREGLPECVSGLGGRVIFIQDENAFSFCDGSVWGDLDLTGPAGDPGVKGDKGDPGGSGAVGEQGPPGENGKASLISLSQEPSGNNCVSGGVKVEHGIDDNSSGSLEAGEVDGTKFVCNGVTPSVCTTQNISGGAQVTCNDGSTSFLASEGVVLAYPQNVVGQSPPIAYPSGEVVYYDAEGNLIGKVRGWTGDLLTEEGKIINVDSSGFTFTNIEYYYLEKDCAGPPSIRTASGSFVLYDIDLDKYFISNGGGSSGVLVKSRRAGGVSCSNSDYIDSFSPPVEYILSDAIKNAVFPLEMVQLS